jgi:hypothetical protein
MRIWLSRSVVAILGAIVVQAAHAQPPPQTAGAVVDLGDREQDKIYPLTLTAQNANCNANLDFRFVLAGAPFVVALQDPVVRNVPPGGRGNAPAQLQFANSPPGAQEGVIDIICENCGFIPLIKNCRADKQQVVLRVNVIAPPQPQADAQQQGRSSQGQSSAGLASSEPPGVEPWSVGAPSFKGSQCLANLKPIDAGLEEFLTGDQKRGLKDARDRAAAAAAAAKSAQDELDEAKKKKNKCLEELAALRAAQAEKEAAAAAAQSAADAAQQAVDNGPEQKAVDDAQQALDDYDKDVAAAEKALAAANARAKAQEAALNAVLKQEKNSSAPNVQSAIKYYNEASKAQNEAKKALEATKGSKAARQAALDAAKAGLANAQAGADAKKAEAAAASAAAAAAKAAADAKERECLGLAAAEKSAAANAASAGKAADRAGKDKDKAEDAARGQAEKSLDEQIACKEKECADLIKKWDEHFRRLTNAKKALEQIGYYRSQAAGTGKAGQTSAEAWADYKKNGLKKFKEDLEREVLEGAADELVPGSGTKILLDVLEATYRLFGIRKSALTPGTYAHGRTEGQELRDWLVKNNLAHASPGDEDAKEVEKQMERLMNDPNVIAKDLNKAIEEVEKCKEELAKLKAKKG